MVTLHRIEASLRGVLQLLLLLPFLLSFHTPQLVLAHQQSQPPPRRNEMLVPINSTTALICELVFNRPNGVQARWMRDGQEVARVTGHSNAILGDNRRIGEAIASQTPEPIPAIGFLVIRHTQPEDEGEYWCERIGPGENEEEDQQKPGERTRLRVAFLHEFPPKARPKLASEGETQLGGQLVMLDCPPLPDGVPAPILGWQFNGERITDFPALNLQVAPNGSLLLHNFSAAQYGFYACEAANFVTKTVSQPLFLSAATDGRQQQRRGKGEGSSPPPLDSFMQCMSAYVRNGVLWFLIGCLTTSCVVLAYILGALFLYRLYSFRDYHGQRHRWPRSLLLAPGFRKVVAPMGQPPPAYEQQLEEGHQHSESGVG